jgi:hypothetical protein
LPVLVGPTCYADFDRAGHQVCMTPIVE